MRFTEGLDAAERVHPSRRPPKSFSAIVFWYVVSFGSRETAINAELLWRMYLLTPPDPSRWRVPPDGAVFAERNINSDEDSAPAATTAYDVGTVGGQLIAEAGHAHP